MKICLEKGFFSGSFHNVAAEVPKRRFPNRMDLFLYDTSDVNAVDLSQRYSGSQLFNDLKVNSNILN